MASFTLVTHFRAGHVQGNAPKFFGKGHFKLTNFSNVDVNYSCNGQDWFTLPQKQTAGASIYIPSEIILFDCNKLIVDTTGATGTGNFVVQELPVNSFTGIEYTEKHKIY